jgi:hypothetical protein
MACNDVGIDVLGNARTADDEWDVEIFLERTLLAGLQTVLADVISIVCTVHDVRVVENSC